MEKQRSVARRIRINGIVQGVGFRPFIWQLANRFNIKGHVANTSSGVLITVETIAENLPPFLHEIQTSPPPLSLVSELTTEVIPLQHFTSFKILESLQEATVATLISPDVSVCSKCTEELRDKSDRRYRYPFTNCTDCGPRYSIITGAPYDRAKTSMSAFDLCPDCRQEYEDPKSRRFHAQPNACPVCGPEAVLWDADGKIVECSDPVEKTALLMKKGHCVAIKGIGGFHLAVDATNETAVERLRRGKERGNKPFAVMVDTLETAGEIAEICEEESVLLSGIHRPIVLLHKKENQLIAQSVAPGNRYIGLMLPYTPLHLLLFQQGLKALVMTSGNRKSEPIAIDNSEAVERLKGLADFYLVHNRDIYMRSDDSVAMVVEGRPCYIRRSRGRVPMPVFLNKKYKETLATGPEMKNTVCYIQDNKAILSQHIGNLENPSAIGFFEKTIEHLQTLFDFSPTQIGYDLHPDFESTRYALNRPDLKGLPVQHHHAHIVSCMADNRIDGSVIGIALDGTGLGEDGKIWGGEVMIADETGFERKAHLSYFPMPGGEKAIQEPWRLGAGLLYHAFGEAFPEGVPLFEHSDCPPESRNLIFQMIDKKINSPETSSAGRLFDGISAILGIRTKSSYEGDAAIALEMVATESANLQPYRIDPLPVDSNGLIQINTIGIVRAVVNDFCSGTEIPVIAGRYHQTIVSLYRDVCLTVRDETGINKIALSGGVFQNRLLLKEFLKRLGENDFDVYRHGEVPPNDGGVSLGQAVIAATLCEKR